MRHRHDGARTRFQHPGDVGKHRHRLREVLDRNGDRDTVEARVRQRDSRGVVQVVHETRREPRIRVELDRVHADARDLTQRQIFGQMRHPRGHQVQHVIAPAQDVRVIGRECTHGRVVDVQHEAGTCVKVAVVAFIDAGEELVGELVQECLPRVRASCQGFHASIPWYLNEGRSPCTVM